MSDAKKELIRMIATWHELLAACESALSTLRGLGKDVGYDEEISTLEAAIRRAKGEKV